jgi:hypothetical protein
MKRTVFVKTREFLWVALGALIVGLAGCVSAPATASAAPAASAPAAAPAQTAGAARAGVPVEVSSWINTNGDEAFYGLGISTITDNDSDAFQQASILARENLAASLETEVAAISENYVRRSEAGGETDRVAKFQDATKQIVSQTVRGAKSYGPFANERGSIYMLVYLDKTSTRRDLNQYVDEVFAETEAELDKILGN